MKPVITRLVLAVLLAAPVAGSAQLGIDLSAPPKEEKKPAAKPAEKPAAQPRPKPDEALTLQPLDVSGKSAAKQRLDLAKKLLDEKAWETAALAFDAILRDASLAEAHDEARYQRAKALVRMGLHHAALSGFDEVLARGPQGTKYFHTSLEWVFYVGKRLKNEQPILQRVAQFANQGFPPAYQDKFNYLLSKYEFERGRALLDAGRTGDARGAYDEARRLAAMVRQDAGGAAQPTATGEAPNLDQGDVFARARFVDGLVRYASGDQEGAVESFKDVVRLTNPKRERQADPQLRELAFLQLARIHYQNRQNRYAIWYYGKMPWGGESWLEGLWEASYAHYRIGDYEKTLGNLLTLQSPYFRDEYFPESYVLKAIVYYENCRYPEARQILEEFAGMYEPVYDELAAITGREVQPARYYELIAEAERTTGQTGRALLMRKIMKLAFSDENIEQLDVSIGEIEDELDEGIGGRRAEFRQSSLAADVGAKLKAQRSALVDEAGSRARAKLEYERDGLRTLLGQALRIKIEVSRKEREALEGSLAKGSQVEVVRDLRYSTAVSDEHLYWPYEGEFWRDELGTYSYTLTKGCRDRTPRSTTTARQDRSSP
jgi:tetratricopeptide (TPR) repeat protein